jgi:hypothetical protein
MTKHEVNEKKNQELHTADTEALLASVPLEEGQGDFDQKDQIVPRLAIVQALSAALKKDKPQFVEGATRGDLVLTSTKEVFEGRKGVTFVPSAYRREYPVFIPQDAGGGFVRVTDEAEFNRLAPDDKGRRMTADGHEVVETGTYYGLLVKEDGITPVVISMAKSAFRASKQLGTYLSTYREQTKSGPRQVPPYWRWFKLTTVGTSNKKGQDWDTWVVEPGGRTVELPDGQRAYEAAKAFREVVQGGRASAAHGEAEE